MPTDDEHGDVVTFPLTEVQEAFYTARVLGGGAGTQVHIEFDVDGVDIAAMEEAWNRLVARTDMLRVTVGTDATQTLHPTVPYHRIDVVDLTTTPAAERAGALESLRRDSCGHGFLPGTWPLFRVTAALLGAGRTRVYLTVDELVIDGPSVALLLRQWCAIHRGGSEPAPLAIGFRDYVDATRVAGDEVGAALEYWNAKLDPAELDQPAPLVGNPLGDEGPRRRLTTLLDAGRWTTVAQVAMAGKATPSALLLTLYAAALGPAGLPIVLTTSNRRPVHPDVVHLAGPFISTAVFLAPGGDARLGDRLSQVQRQLWRDLEHSAVSGVRAHRAWARRHRDRALRPIPVVFTSMLGSVGLGSSQPDPDEWATRVDLGATLTHTPGVLLEQVVQQDAGGGLAVSWDFAPGVLDEAAVEAAFLRLSAALARIAEDGAAALGVRLGELLDPMAAPEPDPAPDPDPEPAIGPEPIGGEEVATGGDLTGLPLTEMQSAYLAGRALGGDGAGETRVYQEFLLPGQDVAALEQAWALLVERHAALRGVVERDGTLTVRAAVPRYQVTRNDLTALPAVEVRRRLVSVAARMSAQRTELGRWPMFAVEASLVPGGGTVLHLMLDALLADARSIALLCGQLFALYQGRTDVVGAADTGDLVAHLRSTVRRASGPEGTEAAGRWAAKFSALPAGPSLPDTGARTALSFELPAWSGVCQRAALIGVPADVLLLTAYVDALRARFPTPFTIVVVSWDRPERFAEVVGDFTGLSWLVVDDTLPEGFDERATEIWSRVRADLTLGETRCGLGQLRGQAFRSRGALRMPVVFTRLAEPPSRLRRGGVLPRHSQSQTAQVALDAVAMLAGDTLTCQWDVCVDAMADGRIVELFDRYRTTVRGLAEASASPAQAARGSTPPRQPLTAYLEHALAEHATAPALRCAGSELSYAELDRRSARLANRLLRMGCRPAVPVAVCLDRSADLVAVLLAVLRIGAVYVPVDPGNPADRARYLIEDCGAGVVVADGERAATAQQAGCQVLNPWRDAQLIEDEPATAPWHHRRPEDPVYTIYTSGTTGLPKGCPNTDAGVANRLWWMQDRFAIAPGDRVLQKTPIGFDVSMWELLWPLLTGACLVMADPGRHVDTGYLAGIVQAESVTVVHFVPSMLAMFLREPSAGGCASLRYAFVSGEPLSCATMHRFHTVLPATELHNLYGPTEAAIDVTHWACRADWDEAMVPIGRPIAGIGIHLVDERLAEVPPGTPGEICVSGIGVALGYHNRPELTRERFVETPYAGRVYRTGDLGVLGADGELRFLGRIDDQIKIRGVRVEPAEVERALVTGAGLADARVFPLASGEDIHLAALCVASGPAPAVADVRRALSGLLPATIVPSRYRFVDAFPLTANGKLDRAAAGRLFETLPEPTHCGGDPAGTGATALRATVTDIVRQVMDLPEIPPDADLFDLGATSFTAIRIAQQIGDRVGRQVPVDVMIDAPSVDGIVEALSPRVLRPAPGEGTGAVEDAPPAGENAPDIRIAFDQAAKQAFKEARVSERALSQHLRRTTLGAAQAAETLELFDASSFREFDQDPVPVDALLRLLATIAWGELDGRRKRRYPSAGGFYPVQIYVQVRRGRIAGLAGGLYYLHPTERALILLDGDLDITDATQVQYNRPLVAGAAFGLFLVSTPAAIAPAYGQRLAARYTTLEAGHLCQLLMVSAPALGLGMCPVGEMDFAAVRDHFRLDEQQELLVSLWGGALTGTQLDRRRHLTATPAASQTVQPDEISSSYQTPTGAGPGGGIPEPVAVVGFATLLPGADTDTGTDSLTAFGRLLESGNVAIGATPQQRWAPLRVRSARHGTTVGGFLADVASCEAEEFGLTDDEAAATDPQERLLLATTRRCIEDAGVTPERLAGAGPVGVFVGAMWADSALYGVAARADGTSGTYANRAGLAHRISHAFNLTGPSVVIDNGCVSGLAAFDAALRAVRSRQCAAAVVGAGNLVLHPDHLDVLAALGLVAEETDSCPLTERASGWIVGEGIGAALLKPLADAVADGDTIHAVIRGSAVRHTGSTRQFGLPSRTTQETTIRAALADAALDPRAVGYVEAAAAGAALGDSIELAAVASVFAGDDPVLIGSVKPVVGHLEAASVFAQLARVICQFRSGRVHPALPKAAVSTATTVTPPVRLVTEAMPWPARPDRDGPPRRRAVINAVAGTGAYGCLVVEEPPPPTGPEPGDDPAAVRVLPLSADTPQHLAALALAVADHIETTAGAVPLDAVARTLRQGRRARPHRGVVAATSEDAPRLLRELAARLDTGQEPLLGPVPRPYAAAVRQWLAGAEASWPGEPHGSRTPLPPTPLRTRRFWPPGCRDTDGDPLDRFSRIVSAETGVDPGRLTAQTDLLALGVTSRQLQRIAARVRAAGGEPLPLERLFAIDNLAELAGTAFGGVR